jgi:hypothetical protein
MELINDTNAVALSVGPGCTPSDRQTLPFLALGPLSAVSSSKLFLLGLRIAFKATEVPFLLQPLGGGVGDAGGGVAVDSSVGAGVGEAGIGVAVRDAVVSRSGIHGKAVLEGCWMRMSYNSLMAGEVFEAGNSRSRLLTSFPVKTSHTG